VPYPTRPSRPARACRNASPWRRKIYPQELRREYDVAVLATFAPWQCNDVRVTVTSRSPDEIEYDLGGMIWGGSRFAVIRGHAGQVAQGLKLLAY
jgi:hypothetical protein